MNRLPETLAIVAHELRNPVGAIRNAVRMMETAGELPGTLDQARRLISRQAGMLSVLIDDLLQLPTLTQSGIELKRDWLDVVAIVDAAVEACSWAVRSAGHSLRVDVPPAPFYAYVDGHRLRQAVTNLLDNACKYTRPFGRIRLSLEANSDCLVLAVEDNGIGIAGDVLPRIFDLFERGATPRGLGIGLTLVREIACKHGGSVEASSQGPGKGSTFRLRVPVPRSAHTPTNAGHPDTVPGGLAAWQLKGTLDYIHGNLVRTMSIAAIAAAAGLGPSRFHRAFKRSFGMSAHLYVIRCRIEMAQHLMMSTSDSLSTIAANCGMCDQSHLTRWFTRLVGAPPNRWRRAHQPVPQIATRRRTVPRVLHSGLPTAVRDGLR